jgi:hypothetical protein
MTISISTGTRVLADHDAIDAVLEAADAPWIAVLAADDMPYLVFGTEDGHAGVQGIPFDLDVEGLGDAGVDDIQSKPNTWWPVTLLWAPGDTLPAPALSPDEWDVLDRFDLIEEPHTPTAADIILTAAEKANALSEPRIAGWLASYAQAL